MGGCAYSRFHCIIPQAFLIRGRIPLFVPCHCIPLAEVGQNIPKNVQSVVKLEKEVDFDMGIMNLSIAFMVALVCETIVLETLNTVGIGGLEGILFLAILPGSFILYVLTHI